MSNKKGANIDLLKSMIRRGTNIDEVTELIERARFRMPTFKTIIDTFLGDDSDEIEPAYISNAGAFAGYLVPLEHMGSAYSYLLKTMINRNYNNGIVNASLSILVTLGTRAILREDQKGRELVVVYLRDLAENAEIPVEIARLAGEKTTIIEGATVSDAEKWVTQTVTRSTRPSATKTAETPA